VYLVLVVSSSDPLYQIIDIAVLLGVHDNNTSSPTELTANLSGLTAMPDAIQRNDYLYTLYIMLFNRAYIKLLYGQCLLW